jgi:hypothetical protein
MGFNIALCILISYLALDEVNYLSSVFNYKTEFKWLIYTGMLFLITANANLMLALPVERYSFLGIFALIALLIYKG